jgi:hypothetical protein
MKLKKKSLGVDSLFSAHLRLDILKNIYEFINLKEYCLYFESFTLV